MCLKKVKLIMFSCYNNLSDLFLSGRDLIEKKWRTEWLKNCFKIFMIVDCLRSGAYHAHKGASNFNTAHGEIQTWRTIIFSTSLIRHFCVIITDIIIVIAYSFMDVYSSYMEITNFSTCFDLAHVLISLFTEVSYILPHPCLDSRAHS